MSPRITIATAARVMLQLRRDPRTIAMLLLVPCLLEVLLYYVLDGQPLVFQRIGAPLLGIFPFISMFLVTAITMLRERTTGTLERLMSMPLSKLDLQVAGSEWAVAGLAIANAILGMALGLFVSAFAQTEFQAVQFMPAVVIPQLLLCGLFLPRTQMPAVLEAISNVLPLSHAVDAMTSVSTTTGDAWGGVDGSVWFDLGIVLAFAVAGLVLGAATLRRRTA